MAAVDDLHRRPEALFACPDSYRDRFERGLMEMLEHHEELGVLILVLANASYDPVIWPHLHDRLRARFDHATTLYGPEVADEDLGRIAVDDLTVFRRLLAHGFEELQLTEHRRLGPWEVQFNQLRSFRPPRMSDTVVTGISAPFDPCGFHFGKPFLRKELIWEGEMLGHQIELFYNKFPFVDQHALLVPDLRREYPQLLGHEHHLYIWRLLELIGATIPGAGFGYNSYGAYSSVNHLHFQMFIRDQPLPVADPLWSHNGGGRDYPTGCLAFDTMGEGWAAIDRLQRSNISFNLIYMPGRLYCLPRAKQGSYQHSDWTGGFAWYEMAGGFTTFNRGQFSTLTEEQIEAELQKLQLVG